MNIEELYKIYLTHPNIQTDTRKIQTGEIFFALKGENFNGNTFAQRALDAGAAYVVIDAENYCINEKTILVADVLETLQLLAKHHRQQFKIPFLAITGSNGKTTTKELINVVMSKSYKTYCTFGNLNNHIGVPLTLLNIKNDAKFAIIEMGANHQGEIASYCQWAMPTHVLINNCGKAHLEGFGGIEGVRKGKGELYDYAKQNNCVVFRNTDLDYLLEMKNQRNIQDEITYGSANANFVGRPLDNHGMLDVAITSPNIECLIKTNLVGDYNFANVMAAVTLGCNFGIDIQKVKLALEEYIPSNSRSQLIKQASNTIILDAYNANPSSMKLAIENFARTDYGNKILMLGGMWELGQESLLEHQAIIDLLQQWNWNAVVLVGGDFEKVSHSYIYFDNNVQAKEWLQQNSFTNTAILIKGSRATAMEKVLS